MSRKTKKEKIIAELRRELVASRKQFLPRKISEISQSLPAKDIQPTTQLPENIPLSSISLNPPSLSQTQSLYIYPVQLIKKDLTKTMFLCILTISLEIALFLFLENRLILPFKIK